MEKELYRRSRAGKVFGGLIIVGVGILLLLKKLGMEFPEWMFTWPALMVVLGFFIGAKHSFRGGGWIIVMIAGGLFLMEKIYPETNISQFIWPAVIIAAGLMMMFKPHRQHRWHRWRHEQWRNRWEGKWHHKYKQYQQQEAMNTEDLVESVSVFGNEKKKILSKNFKGGEVVAFFGGVELDLSQADITEKAILDVTAVFGGVKLIIPPHWEIKSEAVVVLGGIEDKRPLHESTNNPDKILVIKGTAVFGGIDIRSY